MKYLNLETMLQVKKLNNIAIETSSELIKAINW